jgi:DNA-binding MarR family transcriptional regulator
MIGHEGDLEQGQMDALDLLARRDRMMRGLAERLRIDPSTATRAVDRLVDDGLVERYAAHDDGRVVMVRLTTEGRRRHQSIARRRSRVMKRVLAEFGRDDGAILADLFDRFIDAVDGFAAELDSEPPSHG